MWDGINRRQFPRVHYRCLISIGKKDPIKIISTYTENVGSGGICVIVGEDLGLFQGVSLELDLQNGVSTNIKCNGTVVWVVKKRNLENKKIALYDTGIEFVDLAEDHKRRITKIVETELKNAPNSRRSG